MTKRKPFELLLGYEPVTLPIRIPNTDVPSVSQRLSNLAAYRNDALAAHELARHNMMERITSRFKPFKIKDKVWLEARNLRTSGRPEKFKPKREGPFTITEVLSPLAYRLKLPERWKIHPVFHASLLTPYRSTEAHGPSYSEPPPDLVEGENEYEVEAILAHRGNGNRRRYLVRWKGYSSADDTWESERNLKNASEVLSAYKKLNIPGSR